MTAIYYLKHISNLKNIDWDVQTITAGDYTVELAITPEAYDRFIENHFNTHDRAAGVSTGESFKTFIRKEVESTLTRYLKENGSGSDDHSHQTNQLTEVKIADIVFAFNNQDLINLLKERGQHITYQRYKKMREVEKEISQLKDSKFNDLTRPISAFITFEEEDAYLLALEFNHQFTLTGQLLPAKSQLLGEGLYFEKATEPTNIIWENRFLTKT